MARFFDQQKIDEFKECFYFNARKGNIQRESDLSVIMRSLGYSPTKQETHKFFEKYAAQNAGSQGGIDFASFLDIMHEHSEVENCKNEMMAGFMAQDEFKRGVVSASEMRHILMNLGEKLSKTEVDNLFQEVSISRGGDVPYKQFVDAIMTPSPDY